MTKVVRNLRNAWLDLISLDSSQTPKVSNLYGINASLFFFFFFFFKRPAKFARRETMMSACCCATAAIVAATCTACGLKSPRFQRETGFVPLVSLR